jgi:hypothetical protein
MNLKDMPVVTVEQIIRYRILAISTETERDLLLEAAKNYIAALDQWENTNKAERRVARAESVLRHAIKGVEASQ